MASPTKKTDLIRKNKKANSGKTRKKKNKNKGTTPSNEELFGDK